jgi:hypothetical protein
MVGIPGFDDTSTLVVVCPSGNLRSGFMIRPFFVRVALAFLLAGLAFPADAVSVGPVDVPDEFGLGERLALVAWLRERKVVVADPNDLPALRDAYWHLTRPAELDAEQAKRTAKKAELDQIDELKTQLWVRHRRSITGFPAVAELKELLTRLDAEAETVIAAQRAEADRLSRQEPPSVAAPTAGTSPPKAPLEAQTAAPGVVGTPTTDLVPDVPEPPPGSWREANSEAGTTYRLLYSEVVQPLRRRPGPRPAWYATAIRFMENAIVGASDPVAASVVSLEPVKFKDLQASGCNDPGVQAIACINNGAFVNDPDQLFAALERDGYPRRLRHACAVKVVEFAWNPRVAVQSERHQRYSAVVMKLGNELLHCDARNQRLKSMLALQLRNTWNVFYPDQKSLDWNASYVAEIDRCEGLVNAVDPWLAAMIRGQYELMLAWKDRGNGYAAKVTDAGWEGFRRHQEAAKAHFEAAWALDPTQPLAATMRIAVAMGMSEGAGAIMTWLDRAVTACPDHRLAYSMATLALSPQWGGTPLQQLEVARRALRTGDFTSPAAYRFFDALSPPGVRASWEEVSRVLRGYIDSPSYREARIENLHRLIRSAYEYRHSDVVVSAISELNGKLDSKRLGENASKIMEMYQKAKDQQAEQPAPDPPTMQVP